MTGRAPPPSHAITAAPPGLGVPPWAAGMPHGDPTTGQSGSMSGALGQGFAKTVMTPWQQEGRLSVFCQQEERLSVSTPAHSETRLGDSAEPGLRTLCSHQAPRLLAWVTQVERADLDRGHLSPSASTRCFASAFVLSQSNSFAV